MFMVENIFGLLLYMLLRLCISMLHFIKTAVAGITISAFILHFLKKFQYIILYLKDSGLFMTWKIHNVDFWVTSSSSLVSL
jgi:hypothetical protein